MAKARNDHGSVSRQVGWRTNSSKVRKTVLGRPSNSYIQTDVKVIMNIRMTVEDPRGIQHGARYVDRLPAINLRAHIKSVA